MYYVKLILKLHIWLSLYYTPLDPQIYRAEWWAEWRVGKTEKNREEKKRARIAKASNKTNDNVHWDRKKGSIWTNNSIFFIKAFLHHDTLCILDFSTSL